VRLEWDGKPTQVERISLPFQTVETINESRATRERDEGSLLRGGEKDTTWRNQLIWGDNKLVMSSLLADFAGQISLIYIDPPFATGADFKHQVRVGTEDVTKEPSVLEEFAYRDTWGKGNDSYLTMMYERLTLIHELLAESGALFLHVGVQVNHMLRLVLEEIFGPRNVVDEIIWSYGTPSGGRAAGNKIIKAHEYVLHAVKSYGAHTYHKEYLPYDEKYLEERFTYEDEEGRRYRTRGRPSGLVERQYLDESKGVPLSTVWTDIKQTYALHLVKRAKEETGFPTQKPEALLERVVSIASNEGDLVADFFVGSGTTVAVAEKLNRRWIGCDLGRFAIHTTRKRLLNIPDCRPFEIRNLGSYERQRWRQDTGNGALRGYLDTILAFYRAEPVEGFSNLHGRKAGRMVHVGATDAPVTIDEAEEVMDELADNGIESCDLLGWEWEMGLHDTIGERARRRGLDLRALQIPREVMERRVQEADAVRFFELAYVDLDVRRQEHESKVVLKDFAIPSEDLIPPQVRERITVWSDLIDYWSVDFDHRDGLFHNQWQTYRTRANPALATESDWHEYPSAGRYSIVVKIIDIFGNDTTKLAEVTIK